MSTLLFGLLALPVYLLMLWPLVVASRRVLGVRIRTVRALLGAMVGWVAAGRVLGWLFPNFHTSPGLFAGLLIPIAGCAFLATLTFLFIADEHRLERALGALIAKHVSHGQAPDLGMFTDLFRVVAEFRLSIPPAIAAVFRALATVEGTLALLSPGFNILVESRAFANRLVGERMQPDSLRRTATEELMSLLPVLRRLPRRVDRVTSALEQGRLSVNVRLFADERDRAVVTGMLHELLLAFTGTATGVMAVLLLTSMGGPKVSTEVTLNQLFGYNLLVISALLGLRLLFVVFRSQRRNAGKVEETS